MKFELDYIEQLVNLVSNSQLTELALEDGDKAILLKKEKDLAVVQTTAPAVKTVAAPAIQTTPAVAAAENETSVETKTETPAETKGTEILSPMVGTFYCAPAKGEKPFVEVGDVVSKGQVVCIIEAMKLMNEIEAEASGKVVKILVEDGQPVEYGQVLMIIE